MKERVELLERQYQEFRRQLQRDDKLHRQVIAMLEFDVLNGRKREFLLRSINRISKYLRLKETQKQMMFNTLKEIKDVNSWMCYNGSYYISKILDT